MKRPRQGILIVTYGVGHVRMAIPVIRQLLRRGWEPRYMALTSAGPEAREAGIPACGYRDLLRPGDEEAIAWGERLLGESHNPLLGIAREESVAYLGLCYQDLVEQLGLDGAAARYRQYQRHGFFPLGPMNRALELWRPQVALVTNSPKSERAMLVAARARGIPAVMLDDILGLRPRLFPPFVPKPDADRVCAGSEIARANLCAQGVPGQCIRVTGNPAFDTIAAIDREASRRAVRERFAFGGAPVLLCAPEVSAPAAPLAELLAKVLVAIPDIRLLIRRHPSQWHTPFGALASLWGERCRSAEDGPPHPILAACDVVLAVSSTLAIEAALMECTLLQAGPDLPLADWKRGPQHEDLPLFRDGAARLVTTVDGLLQAVEHACRAQDRAAGAACARGLFPAPGTAAAAVADEVDALAAAVTV